MPCEVTELFAVKSIFVSGSLFALSLLLSNSWKDAAIIAGAHAFLRGILVMT